MALRHDCFIVFDPADRERAARFVERFRDVFIPRSRGISDADGLEPGVDDDELLRTIRRKYVWEATTTVVLTGTCTWARRHVDWEIAAALRDDPIGRDGGTRHNMAREGGGRDQPGARPTALLGIRLPSLAATAPAIVPERFADNVDADYAIFRTYPASSEELRASIEDALVKAQYGTPDNARPLRLVDAPCG